MAELDAIEITKQLTKHHEEIGSLKHRMDEVEEVTKDIHHMATAVELLAVEAKNTGDKVDKMSQKVEKLESKPAEKADKLKDAIVTSVVTLIIGTIVGTVLSLVFVNI